MGRTVRVSSQELSTVVAFGVSNVCTSRRTGRPSRTASCELLRLPAERLDRVAAGQRELTEE